MYLTILEDYNSINLQYFNRNLQIKAKKPPSFPSGFQFVLQILSKKII